ncbi:hypothetical protein [Paraflavitalea pollutisoli]|uniref:hypothetical protein n=1 Tax=Paraflavitalea pollutisoli TaxID=3034143 RepID=UPI0023ED15FB|nr:hypothetical protein [Paraflavitalea sp. H1-2-19X]
MHTFNPTLKRLEPTETQCVYCEMESSTHMDDNYFVPLFKENDRTNIIVYRSVKYNKVPVGIPRCKTCQAIHQEATSKAALIAWSVAVGFVILCFMIWGIYGIFAIFAGIFIGFGGTVYMENKLVRDKGIFTKIDGAKRNDAVQELVIAGWSFTQPTA